MYGLEGHTCTEEESDERKDHLVSKFLVEKEHPQHDFDWHNPQYRHCPFDELQHLSEFPNVG